MAVSLALRQQVIARAGNRCEYCGLSQDSQEAAFHVDHVVPRSANGPTTMENLALACVSCSLRKGARQFGPDPQTGQPASLLNPRQQSWRDHFEWIRGYVVGRSPTARATILALVMNRPLAVAIREEEEFRGRQPPRPA